MSWITLIQPSVFLNKSTYFYIWKTKKLILQKLVFVHILLSLALQGQLGSGHPPPAEYRCAGGRDSPSLSLPQSTRSSKDLLQRILQLIHLALRQAEHVLTQAHLRKQQFLGKTAGKTMSACEYSHPREKTTQEQQKWT